ncbi:30S ribosomal protein S3, chloroplastic [Dendrobium catenatum]|uniref:30S ribosomal protein S3, chloroplastic n=1 Tax=Dendrobium catenatum TaxID=906689 RepID=A0A2I0WFJ4_9ASPA|nr:30S ribosomal protein S3, chloroplastic [Dendrobium catenatum]
MGQKINPLGFRLGTTQSHHSFWFAKPKNFSKGLQEDERIRNCIKDYVKKNKRISSGFEGISNFARVIYVPSISPSKALRIAIPIV